MTGSVIACTTDNELLLHSAAITVVNNRSVLV